MYKNRVPREDMMYARNRVSAADRILASFESKCEEAGVTDCMLMAYSTLGDRSARLVLASHGPIGLEDAKSFVFASTDNKLIPIAASFSRSAGSDAYGLHYASIVAHKAALLMEAFDPQDTNKVCMNASATVFLDQTLGCTWDRKNINGKDYLVRNNGEDVEGVLRAAMSARSVLPEMRASIEEFRIPIEAGAYVRFIGFSGDEGVPFIEVGRVTEVKANTLKVSVEANGSTIDSEIPVDAALTVVPMEAASNVDEVIEYLTRAYGPRWKEVVNQTGAYK